MSVPSLVSMTSRGPVSGSGSGVTTGSGFFARALAAPRRVVLRPDGVDFGGGAPSAVSSFFGSVTAVVSVSSGAGGDVVTVRRPAGRRPRVGGREAVVFGAGSTFSAVEGWGDSE